MGECTAERCNTELSGGITLCHDHTERLEYQLAETDTVWEDLQTTAARMDKGAASVGTGGRPGSRPPANLDALDHGQRLRTVLAGWGSMLHIPPIAEPPELASWMLARIPQIRHQDWAGVILDELTAALNDCRRATDRAAETITLGPCGNTDNGPECPGILTAPANKPIGRCRTCGATVDVHERQAWLIDQSWHIRRPLPDILRALKVSGHLNVPAERVKKWVQRDKLRPAICDVRSKRELFTPASVMEAYRSTPAGKTLTMTA